MRSVAIVIRDARLKLLCVVFLLDTLTRSQERVLRQVRGVPVPRRAFPDGFRESADVMRTGATAHAQMADIERQRGAFEFRDLEPVADEGIECRGKRPASAVAVPMRVAQRLE